MFSYDAFGVAALSGSIGERSAYYCVGEKGASEPNPGKKRRENICIWDTYEHGGPQAVNVVGEESIPLHHRDAGEERQASGSQAH